MSLLFYLTAINAATALAFAWDKFCARRNMWRIKESNLLLLAAIGGLFGARFAQRVFRHKTQKEPFVTYLKWIGYLQITLVVGISLFAMLTTNDFSLSMIGIGS